MASSLVRRRCAFKEAFAVAHPPSASKRHRQSLRRRERNRARRTVARSAVRRARELIAAGAQDDAQAAVREASSILDRAGRKGIVHANNAARRKSRLMRQLNALQEARAEEAAPPKRRTRTTAKPRASAAKTKAPARKPASRSARTKKS
jgi:small subunit ribosomal protein S20